MRARYMDMLLSYACSVFHYIFAWVRAQVGPELGPDPSRAAAGPGRLDPIWAGAQAEPRPEQAKSLHISKTLWWS